MRLSRSNQDVFYCCSLIKTLKYKKNSLHICDIKLRNWCLDLFPLINVDFIFSVDFKSYMRKFQKIQQGVQGRTRTRIGSGLIGQKLCPILSLKPLTRQNFNNIRRNKNIMKIFLVKFALKMLVKLICDFLWTNLGDKAKSPEKPKAAIELPPDPLVAKGSLQIQTRRMLFYKSCTVVDLILTYKLLSFCKIISVNSWKYVKFNFCINLVYLTYFNAKT